MAGIRDPPTEVLEDLAFLARSSYRVQVLAALVSEPRSTRALREMTETSEATLNRILNEFDDRSWAHRTADGEYRATPQGEHISIQFRAFVDSMSVIRNFGEDIAVLPADEMAVGSAGGLPLELHQLKEATVKRQQPEAQAVGREELLAATRESSTINVLSGVAPPREVGSIIEDRVRSGQLSGSSVFTTGLVEHLQESQEQQPNWGEVIEAGFELYRDGDTVPANVGVFDETTFIYGVGEMRDRLIISRNEHVRQWAFDVIERYRRRSEPLDPEMFN